MRTGKFALMIVAFSACIALALVLGTCGGRKQPSVVSYQLSDGSDEPQAAEETESQSVEETLTELAGMECPERVDEGLWVELKDALGEALTIRASSVGRGFTPRRDPSADGAAAARKGPPYKITSTPPTSEANRITDLTILDNGDGTFTLSWHYRNLGDYDQDGVVGLPDIYPLAEHFGETYEPEDVNCVQAVIDGSGNGRIGIEDITPIAMNFTVDVHHYAVEGAPSEAGSYEPVDEISQDAGTGEGRLEYSAIIESPAALWHRVMPYDSEGNPGEPSNAVLRPSNEPVIYEVSPTEGYQHEEYTFTATVSGVEPLTYAWDFGGGANPNTSADLSPTVTLADAGEYSASLTVTNAYGEATFPFTLTVSERDMWVHTWDGPGRGNCYAYDILLEGSTSFYVGGLMSSHSLLMKWDQSGGLVWARTWGGEESEYTGDIAFDSGGNVIAAGGTRGFGEGKSDLLLTKYSPQGDLLQVMTWGTSDYESMHDMEVDTEGNIYLCGNWSVYGGDPLALIVKLDPEWNVLWAKRWGGSGDDRAYAILTHGGAVYLCGETGSFGASEGDAFLLKITSDGEVLWARTWGTECVDDLHSLIADHEGNLLAVGHLDPRMVDGKPQEGLLVSFDQHGNLRWAKTWAGEEGYTFCQAVCVDPTGRIFVAGDSGDAALVQEIAPATGTILASRKWKAATRGARIEACSFGGNGDAFLVGRVFISNDGEWLEAVGAPTGREGVFLPVEGETSDIAGVTNDAEGIVSNPEGVIDVGSGEDDSDVLILKNCPR